jgi:hypothetical protein
MKLLMTLVSMILISNIASADENYAACSISSGKACVINTVQAIGRCEGYQGGEGRALSRWCVDNAVKTAIDVISTFGTNHDRQAISVLNRIQNCRYYPSLNSQPYLEDCVDQLVEISVSMIR